VIVETPRASLFCLSACRRVRAFTFLRTDTLRNLATGLLMGHRWIFRCDACLWERQWGFSTEPVTGVAGPIAEAAGDVVA